MVKHPVVHLGAPVLLFHLFSQACCAVLTVYRFNLFLVPWGQSRRNKLPLSVQNLQSKDNADVEMEKLDYCSRDIYFKKDGWRAQALFINFELKAFFEVL